MVAADSGELLSVELTPAGSVAVMTHGPDGRFRHGPGPAAERLADRGSLGGLAGWLMIMADRVEAAW